MLCSEFSWDTASRKLRIGLHESNVSSSQFSPICVSVIAATRKVLGVAWTPDPDERMRTTNAKSRLLDFASIVIISVSFDLRNKLLILFLFNQG
jgi:hypothetical protein